MVARERVTGSSAPSSLEQPAAERRDCDGQPRQTGRNTCGELGALRAESLSTGRARTFSLCAPSSGFRRTYSRSLVRQEPNRMRREAPYKPEFAVCIMDECRTSIASSRPKSQGLRESRSGSNCPPSRRRPRSTGPRLPRFGERLRRCSVKSSELPEPEERPLKQARRVESRLTIVRCDSGRPGWPAIESDWACLPLTSGSWWVSLVNPSISGRLARCGRVKVSWRPLQPFGRWGDEKL